MKAVAAHQNAGCPPSTGRARRCIPAPAACYQDFDLKQTAQWDLGILIPVSHCDHHCGGDAGARAQRRQCSTCNRRHFVLSQPSSFMTSIFIKAVADLRSGKGDYFIHSGSPSEASSHTFDNTKKEKTPPSVV